jgi:hypothetical protein
MPIFGSLALLEFQRNIVGEQGHNQFAPGDTMRISHLSKVSIALQTFGATIDKGKFLLWVWF